MRILLLALLSSLFAGPAAWALTLEADTLWEGQVRLSETVRVAPGVTLQILPGAAVEFDGGALEVAGTLIAERARFGGSAWQGIVLKGCDDATRLTGCTVKGARVGIFVGGGAPRLVGLELSQNDTGMEVKQKSAATIEGCTFVDNRRVGLFIKDESVPTVRDCLFEVNGRFGAYIYRATPRRFSGNRFVGNPTGLMVSHQGSAPRIEDNLFGDNELGVLVDRAARPVIVGNRMVGNGTALRLYRRSDAPVEGNLFERNKIAVSIAYSSYPRLLGNDFAGNGTGLFLEFQSSDWERLRGAQTRKQQMGGQGAFGQGRPATASAPVPAASAPQRLDGHVDARGNWWDVEGTAELGRIGAGGNPSFIDDGRDRPTFIEEGRSFPLDTVIFAPWAGQPQTSFGGDGN